MKTVKIPVQITHGEIYALVNRLSHERIPIVIIHDLQPNNYESIKRLQKKYNHTYPKIITTSKKLISNYGRSRTIIDFTIDDARMSKSLKVLEKDEMIVRLML